MASDTAWDRRLSSRFLARAAVIAALSLMPLRPAASQAQSPVPTVHVKVDLQPIEAVVRDAQGNSVLGLSAKDFTILENGRPQQIAFFDAGNAPASLVVLVDSADSVVSDGRLGSARTIAAQFLRTARSGDEIAAMEFTDKLGPLQQITPEQALDSATVALAAAPGAGSALYDALASTLCRLRSSNKLRQAVVVISDGVDQHSRIRLEQLIGLVRSSRAQVFMIGMQSKPQFNFGGHVETKLTLVSGHDIDNPVVVFDRLMKESGAESFIPKSESRLEEALKAVSDTLPTQYTLAYYPESAAQKLRKIEVKVDRAGATVLARRFVGSDGDSAETVHFDGDSCLVSPQYHAYPYEARVTPSGPRVYREDFADPRSGWPQHENSHYTRGGYELVNPKAKISRVDGSSRSGSLIGQSLVTSFRENVIAAYGPWWTDFRLAATMSASLDSDARDANSQFAYAARPAAGLVFRLNQDGYYAVLVSGASGPKQFSLKLVRREFQGDSYLETDVFPWVEVNQSDLGRGAELSVQAVKNELSVFVDGRLVKAAREERFDEGYVGFVVSGPGRAVFRNLTVEEK